MNASRGENPATLPQMESFCKVKILQEDRSCREESQSQVNDFSKKFYAV